MQRPHPSCRTLQQHPTTCAKNAPKHAVASRANYARPKDDTLTSHLREAFKLLEGRLANCDHDSPEPITFSALERELPVAGFSDALFANTFSPPPASSTLVFSSHVLGHRAVKHTGRFHPDINSAPIAGVTSRAVRCDGVQSSILFLGQRKCKKIVYVCGKLGPL